MQRYSTKCPFCSRLHWVGVGGCSHYVFDTRAITLFSHPQMNTAKLQTPAVTLLQISHNSLNISQAVQNYTAAPFPSSAVPSEHPTSCHSHYSCSPNLTLNVERGNEWSRKSADKDLIIKHFGARLTRTRYAPVTWGDFTRIFILLLYKDSWTPCLRGVIGGVTEPIMSDSKRNKISVTSALLE